MSEEPDLDVLMNRDPLDLTDPDLDRIIGYLRSQRSNYAAGDKKAGAKPKDKKPVVNLSLDDLGL